MPEIFHHSKLVLNTAIKNHKLFQTYGVRKSPLSGGDLEGVILFQKLSLPL
jgi:hypothetical protein